MMTIKWGRKLRVRQADRGHSPVRYGIQQQEVWSARALRRFTECQCGTITSARGRDCGNAIYSHTKHQKRAWAKLDA